MSQRKKPEIPEDVVLHCNICQNRNFLGGFPVRYLLFDNFVYVRIQIRGFPIPHRQQIVFPRVFPPDNHMSDPIDGPTFNLYIYIHTKKLQSIQEIYVASFYDFIL